MPRNPRPSIDSVQAPVQPASTTLHGADGLRFVQDRLALFGLVGAAISGALLVLVNLAYAAVGGASLDERLHARANLPTLLCFLAFGTVASLARRPKTLSSRLLGFLDALPVIAVAAATTIRDDADNGNGIAPLIGVLAVSDVLVLRSVTIPSGPRRTFLLGLLGAVPMQLTPLWNPEAIERFLPDGSTPAVMKHVLLFLWTMMGVAAATVASRVIYGLRRTIKEHERLGRYQLIEKIGSGGMGVVYRARHDLLRRETAVKLLLPEQGGPENLARFEREVQATSQLTSPHTISIYDYGRTPEGTFYYAMELLGEGSDLDALVRRTGPMPPGRVIHVLRQICESLAEAHDHGLVHRDIKPANVFLGPRGGRADNVKVLDFGLVKETTNLAEVGMTMSGVIAGSPRYMAPEAITSRSPVDRRSDIYSLGAVGWFLLAGRAMFEDEDTFKVLARQIEEPAVAPSVRTGRALPADLEALILACLEKDPERRPADAREVERRLAALQESGTWTDDDARAFWRDHRLESTRSTLADERTLRIDFDARRAARGPAQEQALDDGVSQSDA